MPDAEGQPGCSKCGHDKLTKVARAGRTIPFRNVPALPVPADFLIPTCARCRHEELDEGTVTEMQRILVSVYNRLLQRRVRKAIVSLSVHWSQARLEKLLGLSQGYLSRLKVGDAVPSPELVSNLASLALDPVCRLRELERYWGEPDEEPQHAPAGPQRDATTAKTAKTAN